MITYYLRYQILCRKEISYIRMSQKEREQLHAEFSILHSLRHPNIVGYYHREHLKATQELHIYMEYCDGGDLSKVIKSLIAKNQFAEEEYVWSIFAQLVTALYRCHYGVDPPEVGKNFMGAGNVKPYGLRPKNQIMILHRDLKPDNGKGPRQCFHPVAIVRLFFVRSCTNTPPVFLGADNSVKLGDFGLSKLMQSHDFASTYVGTPYYMSPEICAAEKYTLHSDVWSLGCIMYELCMRKPPFDAKTHFHLVQRIKEGKYEALPSIYSAELQNVIKSCLKTNPNHRPDTAALLNLPVVRLMRKEREVVEVGRLLKLKEAEATANLEKLKLQIAQLEQDKVNTRAEIESTVRREWEVKARLEIDRLVGLECATLQKRFETEFPARVQEEVEKHLRSLAASKPNSPTTRPPSSAHTPSEEIPHSSISMTSSHDFPSQTDLTSLSFESPMLTSVSHSAHPLKKSTRTPFTRARTTYDSPMDVHMASPSPMSITSLALSPRRTAAASTLPNPQNIFAAAAEQRARWEPHLMSPSSSDDESFPVEEDEDELPELPSPTRVRKAAALASDPFKLASRAGSGLARPGIRRGTTAPMAMPRLQAQQPALFATKPGNGAPATNGNPMVPRPRSPQAATGTGIPTSTSQGSLLVGQAKPVSPTRRTSKVPFLAADGTGSPTRRPSVKKGKMGGGGEEMLKAVVSKNMFGAAGGAVNAGGLVGTGAPGAAGAGAVVGGLGTGVGLGQGRTLVELNQNMHQGRVVDVMKAVLKDVEEEKGEGGVRMAARVLQWESKREESAREEVVWDPERDEMPSPFLARKGRGLVR